MSPHKNILRTEAMYAAFFDALSIPGICCNDEKIVLQNRVCAMVYPGAVTLQDIVPRVTLEHADIMTYKACVDCYGRSVELVWSSQDHQGHLIHYVTIADPRPQSAGLSTVTECSVETSVAAPSQSQAPVGVMAAAHVHATEAAKTLQSGVSLLRSLPLTDAYRDAIETIETGLAQVYRQANIFSFLSRSVVDTDVSTVVNIRQLIAQTSALGETPVRITHLVPILIKLPHRQLVKRALREMFACNWGGLLVDMADGAIVIRPSFIPDASVADEPTTLSRQVLAHGAELGLWRWSGSVLSIMAEPAEDIERHFDLLSDVYEGKRILIVGESEDERVTVLRQLAPWRFDIRLATSHQELELMTLSGFNLAVVTDSANEQTTDFLAAASIPTVYGGRPQELLGAITTQLLNQTTDNNPAAGHGARKLRILLLTDDAALQQMATTLVQKDGHTITIGRGSVLSSTSIDLMLVDWGFVAMVKKLGSMYPSAVSLLLVARDEKQQSVATRLRDQRLIAGTVVKPLTDGALRLAIRQISG